MSLLVILFFLILLAFSRKQFRSYLNPVSIYAASWAGAQIYLLLDARFSSVTVEAQAVFLGAGILFWLGATTILSVSQGSLQRLQTSKIAEHIYPDVRLIYGVLFGLLLVGFFIYIAPYWSIYQSFDSLAGYIGFIRRSTLQEGIITHNVPMVGQVPLISGIFSLFLAAHYTETQDKYVGRFLLLVLIITIVSGGAAGARSLFMRFLAGVCIIFLLSGRFSARSMNIRLIVILVGAALLFVFLGALRAGDDFSTILLTFGSGLTATVKYLFGSIILFSERFSDIDSVYSTYFTYGWVANLLGNSIDEMAVLYTPYGDPELGMGNTYTFMGPLINDFGLFGAMIWVYLFGAITTFFFLRINQNYFYFVCYSILASSIFFTVFSEYFIKTVPFYFRVFAFYLLIVQGSRILAGTGFARKRRQMHFP